MGRTDAEGEDEAAARDAAEPGAEVADLPPALLRRLAAMAADALGRLTDEEVPPAWRRVARFAPGPRARHANPGLLVALEQDPSLRQRVATQVRERYAWSAQVDDGDTPAGVEASDLAAAAWLLRPDGWADLVRASIGAWAAGEPSPVGPDVLPQTDHAELERLREELAAARAEGKRLQTEGRAELEQARRDLAALKRELRAEIRRREQAEKAAEELATATARQRGSDERRLADADAEKRRLRSQLRDAETAREQTRKAMREARSNADARLRLLLDTLVEAALGLRRELALPPVARRPADDVVAAGGAVAQATAEGRHREGRARADDDPGVLEAMLSLPQAHLLVDGYNVTKEGYGALTLEQQRDRLTGGLIALAARTRVEVTVVFDGAAVGARFGAAPRGVRVAFSPPGETADDVIRRLVRAEPPGRPVIVVSSDREVADGVAAAGARPVPSRMLLQLLGRG